MLNHLQKELIIAIKNSNKHKIMGLRNIIGKLKTAQINKGATLNDNESIKILRTFSKQLNQSINEYQKGGRQDLANKELFELNLVETFLPKQLSVNEIRKIVVESINSTNAQSIQDLGKVMGYIMKHTDGNANGKLVQKIVKEELK